MIYRTLILSLAIFLTNCYCLMAQNIKTDSVMPPPDPAKLIEHVKLAINPKFSHWVLFSNGTYVIVEDTTKTDAAAFCTKLMKQYGPVNAGGPAGDFGVTHLNRTEGWVVSGYCNVMYTYVSPTELTAVGLKNPSDLDIGIFGRHKRDLDGKECKIIHINK